MFKRRLQLPSPAFVISMATLGLVLGGTAVGATTAKHRDAKQDKALIKKMAPSLSVKHAQTADSANTAANATHATSADSATNASNLGGQPADHFLAVTGTAADSQKLGGLPASQYTQGRGSQVFRRAVASPGGSVEFLAVGFGTLTGNCSAGDVPTISFTPSQSGENYFATVITYPGTVSVDTLNAIGFGVPVTEGNGSGGPQMITYQLSYTDLVDHVATVVATGQFLNGTGCLFTGHGLTTG